ncbi:hypothetical protein DPMN_081477 [Dreissena polymorpha]|uniref:Uncharacterized protein n=1 Tax=Dreissena polymorpha TaxID=45954 RepID=A0A9D3Y509_DREPO|nr:hypothetical protein DPMN_081477 [Dreissena polymorpha]
MPVHYSTGLTLKKDTMNKETTASIKTADNYADNIETTTLPDYISDKTHAGFNKSVEHVDITATSLPGGYDTFYKKFIIIRIASAVSVVIIAASLLIYLYRKYSHLSVFQLQDAFVSIVAPVHATSCTNENTNAEVSDVVEENRQLTFTKHPHDSFFRRLPTVSLYRKAQIFDIFVRILAVNQALEVSIIMTPSEIPRMSRNHHLAVIGMMVLLLLLMLIMIIYDENQWDELLL